MEIILIIVIALIITAILKLCIFHEIEIKVNNINTEIEDYIESDEFDKNFDEHSSEDQNTKLKTKIDDLVQVYNKSLLTDFLTSDQLVEDYLIEKEKDFEIALAAYEEQQLENYLENQEPSFEDEIAAYEEQQLENYLENQEPSFEDETAAYEEQQIEGPPGAVSLEESFGCDYQTIQPSTHVSSTQEYKVEKNAFDSIVSQCNLDGLFHMTHIVNISSIFEYNLLSHNLAHSGKFIQNDISMHAVNNRRNKLEPINNKNLHDYVPLYFSIKNPMMYVRKGMSSNIIILKINNSILNLKNAIFSDGNAASQSTAFYNNLNQLNNLSWDCLNNSYWNDYTDGKRKKCAEVLVPDLIEPKMIDEIICSNFITKRELIDLVPISFQDKIVLNPGYYFR
jgi:hypothetical protein